MEANDMKAMREALMTIRKRLVAAYVSESDFMQLSPDKPLVDLIDAALAKPPRQCDVGTADEQADRFKRFCDAHQCPGSNCPLDIGKCPIEWGQMPYVEKEGEDNDR